MRKSLKESLAEHQLLLSRLEAEWSRVEGARVGRDVRDSLYTRIAEVKATISRIEKQIEKAKSRKAAAG